MVLLIGLDASLSAEASFPRPHVWKGPSPSAAVTLRSAAVSALASPTSAAAADIEAEEPPRFDLGDVVLVERGLEHEDGFSLGPLELLGPTPLRGPPPSYPETRVRGFELLPPFRVGASASLSLWSRQACGFVCREVVSDSRYDPWGLESGGAFGAIDRRGRGITNPIAGTIDPEAVAREAAATAVEELSYVGIANGLTSSLLGYDFVRKEEVKGPLARVLAAVSVVPGIPATIRKIDEIPGIKKVAKTASEAADEVAKKTRGGAGPVRRGEEGVAQSVAKIHERGNTVGGREVTFDTSGGRVRVDLLEKDPVGALLGGVESKKGRHARLTKNQKTGYPALAAEGGIPRGEKAREAGLTPGEPIGPFDVRLDRHE